jgi:hypothetical protein
VTVIPRLSPAPVARTVQPHRPVRADGPVGAGPDTDPVTDTDPLAWARPRPVANLSWWRRRKEAFQLWAYVSDLPAGGYLSADSCANLVRQGWSVETFQSFTDGAAACSYARGLAPIDAKGFVALYGLMLNHWATTLPVPLPFRLAASWVAASAIAGPDEAFVQWCTSDALALPVLWGDLDVRGPIAWAAGLTVEEARTQQQTHGLDLERLRALAGLRGHVLP